MSVASVQDLILAAQANQPRSALSELVDSGFQGYSRGLNDETLRRNIAIKLIQQKQEEEQLRQQKAVNDIIIPALQQKETAYQDGVTKTGEVKSAATPMDKFDLTLNKEGATL